MWDHLSLFNYDIRNRRQPLWGRHPGFVSHSAIVLFSLLVASCQGTDCQVRTGCQVQYWTGCQVRKKQLHSLGVINKFYLSNMETLTTVVTSVTHTNWVDKSEVGFLLFRDEILKC